MNTNNLLLELGTEELPPKALRSLAIALQNEFVNLLKVNSLNFSDIKYFATPRRLALYVKDLDIHQQDKEVEIKGPSAKAAYDNDGNPTKAALGWAQANNVDLKKDVQIIKTEKGEWLYVKSIKKGEPTEKLVGNFFEQALAKLPIPKMMRWGSNTFSFVRPVHTLCILFGDKLIDYTIYGAKSSKTILGHRFLSKGIININHADDYENILLNEGIVIADFDKRKQLIKSQIEDIANQLELEAEIDDSLLEEVSSLVEMPKAFIGKFEEKFLNVPSIALVHTMKKDQKYFPLYKKDGNLANQFIFISNINPSDTSFLISGNEKVVRPRLSDAQFFFNTDRKHSLEYFYQYLEKIIYQKDIGTIAYRSEIVSKVATYIAQELNPTLTDKVQRAAFLAKCDLATNLVSEFTDTQGAIGKVYALADNENKDVASAIDEQYMPRFAGDALPNTEVGTIISIAEKIVTIVSIFGINLIPKGDKDPYSLRRSAIGLIRIIIEKNIKLDLLNLINYTADVLKDKIKIENIQDLVFNFIIQRLRSYYQDQNIGAEVYLAVADNKPTDLLDFNKRVNAVVKFKQQPEAEDLAAIYKRINNILAKADIKSNTINTDLLKEIQEKDLVNTLNKIEPEIISLYQKQDYDKALLSLATLRNTVDAFFENVMVNDNDSNIKNNRLAILTKLKETLSKTANISVLY